jgi:hypothetical protein
MKTLENPLTADDVTKGAFETDDGKRKCAMRWIRDTTGYRDDIGCDVFLSRFKALAGIHGIGITAWNDAPERSREEIAATLNRFFIAEGVLKV